jgi:hypothetical protein
MVFSKTVSKIEYLTAGIYFLRVQTEQGVVVKKEVKK